MNHFQCISYGKKKWILNSNMPHFLTIFWGSESLWLLHLLKRLQFSQILNFFSSIHFNILYTELFYRKYQYWVYNFENAFFEKYTEASSPSTHFNILISEQSFYCVLTISGQALLWLSLNKKIDWLTCHRYDLYI